MDKVEKALNALSYVKLVRGKYMSPFLILSWIFFGICLLFGMKVNAIVIICCVYYLAKYFYIFFLRKDADPNVPIMRKLKKNVHGSHRGGACEFGPENTLFNYRRVVNELKTEILEIDLRATKDGHIVLMHDDVVDSTTDGSGEVRSFTLSEIKKFNAAFNYNHLDLKDISVPTLDEVLNEFEDNKNLLYFFDIKDHSVVPKLLKLFEDKPDLKHKIIVGGVGSKINKTLLKVIPKEVPMTPDINSALYFAVAYYLGVGWIFPIKHHICGLKISPEIKEFITVGLIDEMHSRNRKIALFGPSLDDEEVQLDFIQKGVDIIITDRPDLLRKNFIKLNLI
jgi:glycerophosphoryl diester phosphodiesterase